MIQAIILIKFLEFELDQVYILWSYGKIQYILQWIEVTERQSIRHNAVSRYFIQSIKQITVSSYFIQSMNQNTLSRYFPNYFVLIHHPHIGHNIWKCVREHIGPHALRRQLPELMVLASNDLAFRLHQIGVGLNWVLYNSFKRINTSIENIVYNIPKNLISQFVMIITAACYQLYNNFIRLSMHVTVTSI